MCGGGLSRKGPHSQTPELLPNSSTLAKPVSEKCLDFNCLLYASSWTFSPEGWYSRPAHKTNCRKGIQGNRLRTGEPLGKRRSHSWPRGLSALLSGSPSLAESATSAKLGVLAGRWRTAAWKHQQTVTEALTGHPQARGVAGSSESRLPQCQRYKNRALKK